MSKVIQKLDLMHYVKTKVRFNFYVALVAVVVLMAVLAGITVKDQLTHQKFLQQFTELDKQVKAYEAEMHKLVFRGEESNYLIGILPDEIVLNNSGFYHEFEGFANLHVDKLWMTHIHLDDHGDFIQLNGGTLSSNQVDVLLQKLNQQEQFKNVDFKGIDVRKGELPKLPFNKREKAKKLKIPAFYQFTIQTTSIENAGGGR